MENTTLEKIYKASLTFLAPSTLDEVYSHVVEEAIKLVGADSGAIYLKVQNEFKPVYSTIAELYQVKPRKSANTYKAFTDRKPIIADVSDVGAAHPEVAKLGIKSAIFIPLSYKKQSIGVLTLNTRQKAFFDDYKTKVLIFFGSMATLAIRKGQLYDEVRQALDTRDLFISMASHELRTPLTSIIGYSQLLYSRLSKTDTPEARWTASLAWECTRMSNLVQELLSINQIRGGNFHYSWKQCSIEEIVDRVKSIFQFAYPERELEFKQSVNDKKLPAIVGDFDKLIQALTNLLDNAAKFSPPKTPITLSLKQQKNLIQLEIKDQGIGIDNQDLPKVFDKFYFSTKHRKEGMGLGLFLTKDIIEKHHGTISLKTKSNKGTIVTVKLPVAKYD